MNAPAAASGLVVVDKPPGMTSHDVVGRVRRLAGTRKVGHAGTLDPMATGVLLLGVNRTTRLLGHLLLTNKAYDATARLGIGTDTDDAEGTVTSALGAGSVTAEAVHEALAAFRGEIDQVPSSVSAVKVEGRRAYAKVRAGEVVDLPARRVTVHVLEATGIRRTRVEGLDVVDVDLTVSCSSGTYVRAIARDVGAALGVGGHLTRLRRTAVGPFGLEEARSLDQLADRFAMLPIADVARRCFASRTVDEADARDVGHGRRLTVDLGAPGPVAVFDPSGSFLALYEQRGPVAAPVAVFAG